MRRLLSWLREPVDGASLAIFRISFGAILLWDVFRYWPRIQRLFLDSQTNPGGGFQFKYYGWEWVPALPGDGMYVLFAIIGLASLGIMLGLFYRSACLVFLVTFGWQFFIEQANYLNHFYLVILIGICLLLVPADQVWSLRRGTRSNWIPRWSLLGLVMMTEIVLLYAGLVKINSDWLQGWPLKFWFASRDGDYPLLGSLLTNPDFAVFSAWFSMLLHLLGAPLLFFKRTRLIVFSLYAIFHVSNALIFSIGIFPWLTLCATTLFFAPDWPRRWLQLLAINSQPGPRPAQLELSRDKPVLLLFGIFLGYNILMPMRPLIYPGTVAWTEEGHRFSWRMKLRDKEARIEFQVLDPDTGKHWQVNPAIWLTRRQFEKMPNRPDMILQFAHHLDTVWQDKYRVRAPVVTAQTLCSLNFRKPQYLLDRQRDLSTVPRSLKPADWILPLEPSLQPGHYSQQ
ncbi:MAG: HTTM domain-containing protein [Gammaproteobacteria bacterium]|nr:HTTM domain-containing protein [Gammaproteobacteria bacterium]MDH3986154.1 HTTM domain-containing protein [Gammaproteobacteria bacterium]